MSFSPTPELSKEIYLFFVMSTLDEKLAVQNTQKVIASLKSRFQSEKDQDERLIRKHALFKSVELWDQFSKQILGQRQKTVVSKNDKSSPAMNWTNHLIGIQPQAMSIWNKFSRQARPEEILALLVTRILKFNEEELSEAQNVTLGTIRFRLARASKQLGICAEDHT